MKDDLGDRMKGLERVEAGRLFPVKTPICVRIDGKGFSDFTRELKRPYDKRFSDCMIDTTRFLVEQTNAKIGYVQSDEISLIIHSDIEENQVFFKGKIQKIVSVLASMCSVYFNKKLPDFLPSEEIKGMAFFDCRAWIVPDKSEATNNILWRVQDCSKNSVSMMAHHYFDHKELQGKKCSEMIEMLKNEHGIDWEKEPNFFKYGTFLQRQTEIKKFLKEELEFLPEKHKARQNPELEFERSSVKNLQMPNFNKVKNRIEVIFNGDNPELF